MDCAKKQYVFFSRVLFNILRVSYILKLQTDT